MPYVMIPAFHPNTQPLPVSSDPQMTLPLQPIPCKPGENTDALIIIQTLCYDPGTSGRLELLSLKPKHEVQRASSRAQRQDCVEA